MLTAHLDGASVFAPDVDNPGRIRAFAKARRLRCPFCEAPVHFRGRVDGSKIWHFAHFPDATCTVDDPDYRPESQEHQRIKWAIYRWLFDEFGAHTATVEKRVETGQIADVLLQHNHCRIAFEVQRSPLSPENWRERRRGYRSIGVHDIWILVGDRHLSVERSPASAGHEVMNTIVEPKPLARTLLETDGRVLWISNAQSDRFCAAQPAVQVPSAEELSISELNGLAHLYATVPVPPEQIRCRFDGSPFPERPQDLIGAVVGNVQFPMWAETAARPTIPTVSAAETELKAFRLDFSCLPSQFPRSAREEHHGGETPIYLSSGVEKDAQHGPWALESPSTPLHAYDHARRWEKARATWARDWAKRQNMWDAREKQRRLRRKRDALVAVGEVVDAHLKGLLRSLTKLQKAAEGMPEHEIRNHPGIDRGMQKWPLKNWTPLANLNVGLDWIFGVPPRLWQAIIYATQFYHSYAKRYREDIDIDTSGYDFCTSGFAIKALGHRGILSSKCLAYIRFRQASDAIEDVIEAMEYEVEDPPSGGWKRTPPPSKITLHGLRHVVVVSYMESLVQHRFLTRNGGGALPSTLPGYSLRDDIQSACSYVRARDKSSHPPSASTFIHLAEQWLSWARRIDALRNWHNSLVCPFHPPYFNNVEHRRIQMAMGAGQLLPTENGIQTVDGSTLTTFDWRKPTYKTDWMVGKGLEWRSRQ